MCRHFINKCGNSATCPANVMATRNLGVGRCIISGRCWHSPWCDFCGELWSAATAAAVAAYLQLQHVAELLPPRCLSPFLPLLISPLCVIAIKVAATLIAAACDTLFKKSVLIICKTLAIKSFCATCGMSAICALSAAASSHLSPSRIFQSFINTNRVNNEWFTLGKVLLCFCHSQRV